MSIDDFFVRDVTIITPGSITNHGADEPDWDNTTTAETTGWLHQLSQEERQSATRDAEVSTHVLRLPAGTVITAKNRVEIDGQTFNVDGAPGRPWTPAGEHHVHAWLTLIDG